MSDSDDDTISVNKGFDQFNHRSWFSLGGLFRRNKTHPQIEIDKVMLTYKKPKKRLGNVMSDAISVMFAQTGTKYGLSDEQITQLMAHTVVSFARRYAIIDTVKLAAKIARNPDGSMNPERLQVILAGVICHLGFGLKLDGSEIKNALASTMESFASMIAAGQGIDLLESKNGTSIDREAAAHNSPNPQNPYGSDPAAQAAAAAHAAAQAAAAHAAAQAAAAQAAMSLGSPGELAASLAQVGELARSNVLVTGAINDHFFRQSATFVDTWDARWSHDFNSVRDTVTQLPRFYFPVVHLSKVILIFQLFAAEMARPEFISGTPLARLNRIKDVNKSAAYHLEQVHWVLSAVVDSSRPVDYLLAVLRVSERSDLYRLAIVALIAKPGMSVDEFNKLVEGKATQVTVEGVTLQVKSGSSSAPAKAHPSGTKGKGALN